ncbi:MAG: polyamine aminopropyltransferase [Alphaproteobacteria bacterium]|nr:polyamine aminopropyltransferase [Alphaproteobacteria bacterium]
MSEWMEEVDVVYGAWRLQLKIDEVLVRRRGDHHDILLFENKLFGRVLVLDGVVQTTERDEFVFHEMIVHVPLLAHGAARRVLIIGGGDGGALEEVLKHDSVESVTVVEIDSAVVACSREFLPSICNGAFEDFRTNLVIADGVAFVAESDAEYDVILVDSTDPVGPGEALFESSFYRNCRGRLASGGVLVSQFGVPFAEPEWLARPYLRLTDSFPRTACYLVPVPANYGGFLAFCMASGSVEPFQLDSGTLQSRFRDAGVVTRYYTPDIHKAAFALPPYVAEIIG